MAEGLSPDSKSKSGVKLLHAAFLIAFRSALEPREGGGDPAVFPIHPNLDMAQPRRFIHRRPPVSFFRFVWYNAEKTAQEVCL